MFRGKALSRNFASAVAMLLALVPTEAQESKPAAPPKRIAIRAGHLIDGKSDRPFDNVLILIEGDNILLGQPFVFTKDNIDQYDF